MEVHYNGLKPFRTAWVFYLLGFLALLASFPLVSRWLHLGRLRRCSSPGSCSTPTGWRCGS